MFWQFIYIIGETEQERALYLTRQVTLNSLLMRRLQQALKARRWIRGHAGLPSLQ